MSHTFIVNDNLPIQDFRRKQRLEQRLPWQDHAKKTLEGDSLYTTPQITIGGTAPFFHAAGIAFNEHMPWSFTPDSVWLTLLNGIAHAIDANPEAVRHHFVQHEGQVQLEVKRGQVDSLYNVPPSTWESGVREFSEQIQGYLGKKYDLIVNNFTTTGDVEKTASEIALMGAMKNYFGYRMMFCCGLTRVTVGGTPEDWDNIQGRVSALAEIGLGWWTQHLTEVISEFRRACAGNPDRDFWCRMYKRTGIGSGGQGAVSGWINTLYPFVTSHGGMEKNEYIDWQNKEGIGVSDENYPSSLVYAPVALVGGGMSIDAKFYGGLVGVSLQESDMTLTPVAGWSIRNVSGK